MYETKELQAHSGPGRVDQAIGNPAQLADHELGVARLFQESGATIVDLSQSAAKHAYARSDIALHGPESNAGTKKFDLWRDRLLRGPKGVILSNYANALTILREDPELQGLLAFDEMQCSPILSRESLVAREGPFPKLVTDTSAGAIRAYLQSAGLTGLSWPDTHLAIDQIASKNRFHPIRRYLTDLKWDGIPRVDTFLRDYYGTEDTAYTRAVGKMWLISAAARVMQPGCKVDHIPILESEQGTGKSSSVEALCGAEWFSDNLPPIGTKDSQEHLRGKWMVELSELSALKKTENEAIKSFITRRTERFRPTYGRRQTHEPRQCIFVGTTNKSEYLRDETGNRRYWPVKCGKIDLEAIRRDRDQIWAEAVALYSAGAQWWPCEDQKTIFSSEQENRYEEDVRQEAVHHYLSGYVCDMNGKWRMTSGPRSRTTIAEVATQALGVRDTIRIGTAEQNAIRSIMRKLGWIQGKRGTAGVRWWIPGGNWEPATRE